MSKKTVPTEDQEQIAVVQYLELNGYKFTAIPNHTYNPHRSQQHKNRVLGLRRGLPDLLVIAHGHLVFIEMKCRRGSSTSPEQKEWIKALNEVDNVEAIIAKGADEAIDYLEALKTPRKIGWAASSPQPRRTFKPSNPIF